MTIADTPTLEPVHDFGSKLLQPGLRPAVVEYLRWRQAARRARAAGEPPPPPPPGGPLSINLDLTTACNFACDHCIDWDALNGPLRHDPARLRKSLEEMTRRGLRSVILIGGGEPTVHPGFEEAAVFLKDLGLQVAVVSNGSRNERIARIAPRLDAGDWVRLSLDAGTNATFQAMHRPRAPGLTLEGICQGARAIKAANPAVDLGFSFIITWHGSRRGSARLAENLAEMETAAALAKRHDFDYISFKPCLVRASDGAEVLDPAQGGRPPEELAAAIRGGLEAAGRHAGAGFRVLTSTNLRVFLDGTWLEYTDQPRECHMQALRQVVSPLGVFNCPAHRGVARARIGPAGAWADGGKAARAAAERLEAFDAHAECAAVTCLYHPVNHLLEQVVAGGADPEAVLGREPDRRDTFL